MRVAAPALFDGLLALVLAAPLALGAYPAWGWASLAFGCGALLCCWSAAALAGRVPVAVPPPFLRWAASALGLALLWALAQTVGFTPRAWHHPVWSESADALGIPYAGAVSLDPAASRGSVLRIASYAAVFWLAFQYGGDPRRARRALRAVAAGAACYALYGIAATFSGAGDILWPKNTAYPGAVTGPFVNPNSFAAYCGIGLLCATAALRVRPRHAAVGLRRRFRRLLAEYLPSRGPWLAAWLVLAVALPLTLSRAGVAASALALLILVFALAAGRARLCAGLGRAVAFAVLGGALLILVGQGLERRLWDAGTDWGKRSEIYAVTVDAIADAPLSGTGLGTFEAVYRSQRAAEDRRGVRMAHNDYLELALELGIPAAALFVSALLAVLVGCARGLPVRRRDSAAPAVGVSACVLVGAHSLVDFSLQIPAVAATFALVLGVAAAQARPSRHQPLPPP